MEELQFWDLEVSHWGVALANAIVVIKDDLFIVMKCCESCGDFVEGSGVNVPHLSEVTDVE